MKKPQSGNSGQSEFPKASTSYIASMASISSRVYQNFKGAKGFKKIAISTMLLTILFMVGTLVYISRPLPEIPASHWSQTIFDRHGQLLRVWLADDEQLRFSPYSSYAFSTDSSLSSSPVSDSATSLSHPQCATTSQKHTTTLPHKYLSALLNFEDRRFYKHWGIDPLALVRAIKLNIQHRRVVSGASTITMQLARLQNPKARTLFSKIKEALYALRLEWHLSKDEILSLYSAEVPMGSNIVGLKAASWKLFGRSEEKLTWAESALLAVLPNNPGGINLQKGRSALKKKRNQLLAKLKQKGLIDELTLNSAQSEELPAFDRPYPFIAPHFCQFVHQENTRHSNQANSTTHTTLDHHIQAQMQKIIRYHRSLLQQQGVYNVSVIISETTTGKVRAYEGSGDFSDRRIQGQVDGVQSPRSPGSTLKPFLYGLAIEEGPWLPTTMLEDVPVWYGSFTPQNFHQDYRGLVSMQDALAQSLNVPAVNMLSAYGLERFYHWLQNAGLKHLFRPWELYGLPLILGGGEATLWELTSLYRMLGKGGQKSPLQFIEPPAHSDSYANPNLDSPLFEEILDGGAAWQVLEMLRHVRRPGVDAYWHLFNNQIPVSWKTGTSYGGKDAWAIGLTPQWTIGVWVGNFDGHSSAGVTGASGAAPILFNLFNQLNQKHHTAWAQADSLLEELTICAASGYRAGPHCPLTRTAQRPLHQQNNHTCPWHKQIITNKKGQRVHSDCWNINDTLHSTHLILPPAVQYQYRRQGIPLDTLVPWKENCAPTTSALHIEYPTPHSRIFIPRDWDGEHEKLIFRAKSARTDDTLYWYLDNALYGTTTQNSGDHRKVFQPTAGKHRLVIQNSDGTTRGISFTAFVRPNNKKNKSAKSQPE
jgi:penicillin-binding protein 1C